MATKRCNTLTFQGPANFMLLGSQFDAAIFKRMRGWEDAARSRAALKSWSPAMSFGLEAQSATFGQPFFGTKHVIFFWAWPVYSIRQLQGMDHWVPQFRHRCLKAEIEIMKQLDHVAASVVASTACHRIAVVFLLKSTIANPTLDVKCKFLSLTSCGSTTPSKMTCWAPKTFVPKGPLLKANILFFHVLSKISWPQRWIVEKGTWFFLISTVLKCLCCSAVPPNGQNNRKGRWQPVCFTNFHNMSLFAFDINKYDVVSSAEI